ncbi:MAG: zf-TFIIB domain-containing protein [Polyangiaceae bacterium]|nr:zf-TFIIB domain-containing protein [Polyangiaceae bacterium]
MSATWACPRCGGGLQILTREAVSMHVCLTCGGAFLDNATAARLLSMVPPTALASAGWLDERASREVDTAPAVACPVCQRTMGRVHVKAAGVDVDTCGAHGTFYDRTELVKVARACKRARVAPVATGAAVAAGAVGIAAISAASTDTAPARNLDPDVVEIGADVAGAAVEIVSEGVVEGAAEVVLGLLGGLLEALGSLGDGV